MAVIDGTPILESELKIAGQTNKLERQIYDLKLKALQSVIGQRLATKAAAAKNLAVDAFSAAGGGPQGLRADRGRGRGFLPRPEGRINQPLEAVRMQATQALKALKIREARQVYLDGLRQRAQVTINFQAPKLRVEVGNAPRRGPATAPVTIVEFSDFQCPYCRAVESTLTELLSRYSGQISIAHKDMPLDQIHPAARSAAEAARCAQEQDQFWQYRDALFKLSEPQQHRIPAGSFVVALGSDEVPDLLELTKVSAQVQADATRRRAWDDIHSDLLHEWLLLEGAQSTAAFSKLIDAELEAQRAAVR